MYPFQRIFNTLRRWLRPKRTFQLDVDTLESLRLIAEREQTTPQEIAGHLLEDALRREQELSVSLGLWQMLTPREQEVTALICLNFTNRQIAIRLHISPETVKTHVAHILTKFNLTSRNQLRDLMSGLDFSQWLG